MTGLTWDVMVIAESCLLTAWDDLPAEERPARIGIVPGADVAADDCCGGQAWVRRSRTYRSSVATWPGAVANQSALDESCSDWLWAIELGVGVMRCAPTPADDGTPPTVEELRAAAWQISDDEERVRTAMACCFRAALEAYAQSTVGVLYQLGDARSVGPDGDCHGFDMTVTVGIARCPC